MSSSRHSPYTTVDVPQISHFMISVSLTAHQALKLPKRLMLSTHTLKSVISIYNATQTLAATYPLQLLYIMLYPVNLQSLIVKLIVDEIQLTIPDVCKLNNLNYKVEEYIQIVLFVSRTIPDNFYPVAINTNEELYNDTSQNIHNNAPITTSNYNVAFILDPITIQLLTLTPNRANAQISVFYIEMSIYECFVQLVQMNI
ncbi:Hypothetical_protein [Hexamita inflata]|uniref:Hypothetical_protein n=1 Tax=Hexamita inflata TaxID=28002 RepID=A0AA86UZ04_9EUKA|nr:Hypothetical protein HINF_LOCUS50802 [Hexamita inflata]CAI9977725.1 Hypothetical protein HINF_LOCUS65370 [Hexamita inflata]CAI9977748.1 Hypothetical protein HINF_LOCUS65393 [Hexamita inflata]